MGGVIVYERFLWFEQHAKDGRYPNAGDLAEEFEISEKTAQRNIVFMRDRLGCPIVYNQHCKGYFYSDVTFSLSAISLSSADLIALLVARDLLRNVAGRTLGNNISHAVDKIAATLKTHGADVANADKAVSLRFIEHAQVREHTFRIVLEGCLKKRTLEFTYTSPAGKETTSRNVDPYHLYNYMGNWHVIGWCHLRQGFRNFNLSRISAIRIRKQTFSVRPGFDPDHYFASSFGIFKAWKTQPVTLRFSPDKARWVAGQTWHPKQKEAVTSDGSLELTFPAAAFPELAMEILKHGAGVEVVRPPELREMVRAEAEKICRNYQTAAIKT